MSLTTGDSAAPGFALARLIEGHICLHACMAGMRMAAPLLFGTAGAMVGVQVVFWCVGLAVGSGAWPAWCLRPAKMPEGSPSAGPPSG